MKDKNIEEITKKLEQGVKDLFEGENYKNFLQTMSKFYNYSFNNCMLIALQMPEATRVAGFKSWQNNFKRNVKKGEKAIKILARYRESSSRKLRRKMEQLKKKK